MPDENKNNIDYRSFQAEAKKEKPQQAEAAGANPYQQCDCNSE